MREIKFRAWDVTNGMWIDSGDCIMSVGLDGKILLWHGAREENRLDFSGPYDVMLWERTAFLPTGRYKLLQYTGLKDKNGKEIYEGDVVKDVGGGVYEVRWSTPYFACYQPGPVEGSELESHFYDLSLEVIGNVYENPELMKEGDRLTSVR